MPSDPIIISKTFGELNLNDEFFNSLKASYSEFDKWFKKKNKEQAYVILDEESKLQAFLYLKEEIGAVLDVSPVLPADHYLKVGTFKINSHGSKLGERFIKKIFDHAIDRKVNKIYVTIFSEHYSLLKLLEKFGFSKRSVKTTANGTEEVLVKNILNHAKDVKKSYPLISLSEKQYLLSIYPEYHSRLFPDSILNNENISIVDDVSYTNSIQKVYICKMARVSTLRPGDCVVIYRTSDGVGHAEYRSVATSLCMVDEVKQKLDFKSLTEFINYCSSRSIFSDEELEDFYINWKRLYVIKLTYNAAMRSRIIRQRLINEIGLRRRDYWGFMPISSSQLKAIAKLGKVDERLIID